ncbi:stress response protein SCP2 [Nakamurella sp. UYEF19]|uniref:TerD family protein n=1 Tax=Nakamurella sp. UYEF19 TaxID=1756392 RepID=UPI003395429C
MAILSRGANAPLATGPIDVAVFGAEHKSVDLMVFQLGPDRMVRSDADFVFFNQPSSPEGAVRLVAADRITVDLTAVPVDIETLAIAVSMDDGVPGSLAAMTGLAVAVSGAESHSAPASGLTVERAAVLVELYRRANAWKVRNVSAGWAAGLSALAAEHGVSVDDSPPPPATTAQPATTRPRDDPRVALPPAVLAAHSSVPSPSYQPAPGKQPVPSYQPAANYPSPGGFPPPGGNLPPAPDFVPPRPGGFVAPGGSLPAASN